MKQTRSIVLLPFLVILLSTAGHTGMDKKHEPVKAVNTPVRTVETWLKAFKEKNIDDLVKYTHPDGLKEFRHMITPLLKDAPEVVTPLFGGIAMDDLEKKTDSRFYAAFVNTMTSQPGYDKAMAAVEFIVLGETAKRKHTPLRYVYYRVLDRSSSGFISRVEVVGVKPAGDSRSNEWLVLLSPGMKRIGPQLSFAVGGDAKDLSTQCLKAEINALGTLVSSLIATPLAFEDMAALKPTSMKLFENNKITAFTICDKTGITILEEKKDRYVTCKMEKNFPVAIGGKTIGTLTLYYGTQGRFTPEPNNDIAAIGRIMASYLKVALLYEKPSTAYEILEHILNDKRIIDAWIDYTYNQIKRDWARVEQRTLKNNVGETGTGVTAFEIKLIEPQNETVLGILFIRYLIK